MIIHWIRKLLIILRRIELSPMKVAIVCYEDPESWILGKFARRMEEELKKLKVDVEIVRQPDPKADINHHIIYIDYVDTSLGINTVMITHVDSIQKINMLKKQLKVVRLGICMSRETTEKLAKAGIPRNKLCWVNPAHDGVIKPRPLVIGITSKTHGDGRKKENTVVQLAEKISPNDFAFKIMGSGWERIVETIKKKGFHVDYWPQFDYDTYVSLMPTLDYFIYFSWDEGSMGFVDALTAGVQTVVTPQGYHLDAPEGISYPIRKTTDIVQTFQTIAAQRKERTDSVADWTWENYAKKHLELWGYLLTQNPEIYLKNHRVTFTDGVSSLADVTARIAPNPLIAAGHSLRYLASPTTIKTFLWKVSPGSFKRAYKKKLEK